MDADWVLAGESISVGAPRLVLYLRVEVILAEESVVTKLLNGV